ncbi:MAG: Asp-tRNA(Asn)/Glu-tRNA(Gln) amidotransferase subunit GatC [Planctomycetota bacterium]
MAERRPQEGLTRDADGADATEVGRVARLARLAPDEGRTARLASDFERILSAFESLQSIDVDGVEPLHRPLTGDGIERGDVACDDGALDRDELLARAARTREGCFSVPRTVG